MEIFIIAVTAFFVAILTFFSGFGLGTILTPVMMIFFPVDLAVALTGVVHFFNNVFKLFLVGKHAQRDVLIRFGIPAVIMAAVGAWLLLRISDFKPLFSYYLFEKEFEVYPMKLIIALLLIVFSLMDILPRFQHMQFSRDKLPIGGALSGFFGGLSGNQGALRSAFLIKSGLSKEAFIGTAVVVSTFVDFTRLGVYATRFTATGVGDYWPVVIAGTLSAMAGALIGRWVLKKVTLRFLQITVAVLLILVSIALGAGWI